MMFKANASMALELISLVAGTWLAIKAWSGEFCCKKFAKVVSVFVIVLSILLIICSASFKIGYMIKGGHYKHGKGHMGKMMHKMDPEMRDKMMTECPMMKKMQEKGEK
ncbi:MAG: hypothetical protein HN337_04660 [Deltaproteobacteria bacterium]|jgi:hypothetical protein|nr:hypothetical protein [Deltaproteobacteria bacterium]